MENNSGYFSRGIAPVLWQVLLALWIVSAITRYWAIAIRLGILAVLLYAAVEGVRDGLAEKGLALLSFDCFIGMLSIYVCYGFWMCYVHPNVDGTRFGIAFICLGLLSGIRSFLVKAK